MLSVDSPLHMDVARLGRKVIMIEEA
jgi:hypothetical protein